jgi:formylglycine-generating enzyme
LWAILFWPAFLALGFLPGADVGCFWANARRIAFRQGGTADMLGLITFQLMALIPLSLFAGWALQAVVQMCRLRLGGRPTGGQAADYDESPPKAVALLLGFGLTGSLAAADPPPFAGKKAGDERTVAGVKLCWCPPGKFTMGSPPTEPERRPGEDQVEVTLTRGFWMAKFETTQGQWKRVVGKLPGELTAELPAGDDLPVGNVNFAEAEGFCKKLTEQARACGDLPTGWEFHLPTEAQWEYACRAGTTTATAFGDKLSSKQANFRGRPYNGAEPGPSLGRAAKVGGYPPNAWGLHDMHGNTFEWCRDWYHPKLPGGVDPDLHGATATSRVRRGGGWTDDGWPCRSAFRLRFEPERRYDHIGFRVAAVQL